MSRVLPRVAIVGSGISGLAAAHHLHGIADITVFEANDYFGGHTHTVDITLETRSGPVTYGVDTGFLVFNDRTYPHLIQLFDELGIESTESDMSFSVQAPHPSGDWLEWNGASLNSVFAQRRNLFSVRFWGMLKEILRFNTLCVGIAKTGEEATLRLPLKTFLAQHGFSQEFRDWYFLPMMGSIWSCPTEQMLEFPVATMIRFCYNHGLIQILNRPQWRSVKGGGRRYVEAILSHIPNKKLNTPVERIERDPEGVRLWTHEGEHHFDDVIIATHSDQALKLLTDPSVGEREVLSAIPYQKNTAVLHTDISVLPKARAAWAAWNYERAESDSSETSHVCLHYLLNRLQALPFETPVIVSLNPIRPIDEGKILSRLEYDHPVFDLAALEAQGRVESLQGQHHTWFAGAWMGYGFHEDGLVAGLSVAEGLQARYSSNEDALAA